MTSTPAKFSSYRGEYLLKDELARHSVVIACFSYLYQVLIGKVPGYACRRIGFSLSFKWTALLGLMVLMAFPAQPEVLRKKDKKANKNADKSIVIPACIEKKSIVDKLIVTIPAYNEEESIGNVIREIPREIEGVGKVEVIVINDGSKDRTAEVAKEAGADKIVQFPSNKGLTLAFKEVEIAINLPR